ncbi:ATP synthase F1 subunit epsilon [Rhodoflexus caldus]|jgi:F-type H+-transporting ATPase subunit epsilon|uniref:ATP synthase F1 subunit epsilon n=1 Tax=Rhodoflexus caldus TaxID=2891236 RepID=UPI00202A7EF3|nr:ATP synthase F1 subunit epsilon [Rhodoflexus caldus]
MQVEIITPDRKVFEGAATGVQVPGTGGSFEVLENHAPIISALEKGKVRVRTQNGSYQYFEIDGGVIEVLQNNVIVLAESAIAV